MNETDINRHGIRQKLLNTFGDPVLLYTALIMMTIMYHYRSSLTIVYGIAALITGALLIKLYDYVRKHQLIGSAAYIAVVILFIMGARYSIDIGTDKYPIRFAVWFITPQAALDYNRWYTLAIFLMFMIFMSTVVYYFTRVRYRVFMSFLVFIIPFSIYGKEYEKMPVVFIILLSVGYIMLMVKFRELSDTEEVEVIDKHETWRTAGVYALLFAAAASLIPKPSVVADRSYLDALISADQFTDRLMSMLNVFRNSSSGGQFRNVNSDVPLFYAESVEPMRLKTATYTNYDYSSDTWSTDKFDRRVAREYDAVPVNFPRPGALTEYLMLAAELDSDFAATYGLTAFAGSEFVKPEERTIRLHSVYQMGDSAPVPELPISFDSTNYDSGFKRGNTGLLLSEGRSFGTGCDFTFTYYADTFFRSATNKAFIDAVSGCDDYLQLLDDAYDVLLYRLWSCPAESEEYDYIDSALDRLSDYSDEYSMYAGELVDYGNNERIYELAQELTSGLTTDYDKAKVLESYFLLNGYIYDDSYAKGISENAESFLFNTKRGVCYEYATSMVLLARAAGIPARYCEGFNMQDKAEDGNMDFVITAKSAHGFPELYIRGFGWMSFEPTVTLGANEEEKTSATGMLAYAGALLAVFALLLLLFIILYPAISHRFFLFRCKKRTPQQTALAAMQRIGKIYNVGTSNTSHETADIVKSIAGADISNAAVLFDRAAYGDDALSDEEKKIVLDEYVGAYKALRTTRRKRRITT